MNEKSLLDNIACELYDLCSKSRLHDGTESRALPSRSIIICILKDLKRVLFPGYFGDESLSDYKEFAAEKLMDIRENLKNQIETAIAFKNQAGLSSNEISVKADGICDRFYRYLPALRAMLEKDVYATFEGDPAAHGTDDILIAYPGIIAVFAYRVAHILYEENVPLIPRIMTEYAHSRTGIDINAGAVIGENFVIDHGTGVVIGETTVIGNNVKIYQGVTLGALSTRKGQQLSGVKRHPTIGDNVTIYSGASILGGETVIGDGAIIGGNAFITKSIPPHTKVIVKPSELILETEKAKTDIWDI